VFSRRSEADGKKVYFFFEAILAVMSEEDKQEFLSVVSDELAVTDDEDTIRFVLQTLSDFWPELDETARLRIENKLINSAKDGRWIKAQNRTRGGALGTWIISIHNQLALKEDLWRVLTQKLASSDREAQDYVFQYFIRSASEVFEKPSFSLVQAVNKGLKAGDVRFKEAVEYWKIEDDFGGSSEGQWVKPFHDAFSSFQETELTLSDDDDIPF
jgi:hypothetical protein